MSNRRLHVSKAGQVLIREALARTGFKRALTEHRPVILASKYAMQKHARSRNWSDDDRNWILELFSLFNYDDAGLSRGEKEQGKHLLMQTLLQQDKSRSFVEKIVERIESGILVWKDISPTQWKRFTNQSRIYQSGFGETVFEGFCFALGLEVEDIAEEDLGISPQEEIEVNYNSNKVNSKIDIQESITCLLPSLECLDFVGRADEQKEVLTYLEPNSNISHISLHGMGGSGKTSLALKIAYHCREASKSDDQDLGKFDTFLFVSAKPQHLTIDGGINRLLKKDNLTSILQKIAIEIGAGELLEEGHSKESLITRICLHLYRKRTLLIVDNLETMSDINEVLDFLKELPDSVKVISTTRESFVRTNIKKITLGTLPEKYSYQLIQQRCREEQIKLDSEQIKLLCQTTGGMPAAIGYAIGQLVVGTPFERVASSLVKAGDDYCKFYFEAAVEPLRNQPSYMMLMALACIPANTTFEALVTVSTVNNQPPTLADLYNLRKRFLINQLQEDEYSDRYDLISITRQYALSELEKDGELLKLIQDSWINYYRNYVQINGERDWKEWQQDYQGLKSEWENINAVIDLLIEDDRYSDLCHMWKHIRCYVHVEWSGQNRLKYWDYRLNDLTRHLLELSEQRKDWLMLAEIILDRSWKLIVMRKSQYFEEAESLLGKAQQIRHNVSSELQIKIATHTAILYLHQEHMEKALDWLQKAQDLIDPFITEDSEMPFEIKRQQIQIVYHQGEIYFRQQDYRKSKKFFNISKRFCKSDSMEWQRGIALTQNWLAEIAIQLNDLGEAEELIKEGIIVSNGNQDQCRLAYWLRTRARLQNTQGLAEAEDTAREAYAIFRELGMNAEAQEIQDDGLLPLRLPENR